MNEEKKGYYKGYHWGFIFEGILEDDPFCCDFWGKALDDLGAMDRNSKEYALLEEWTDHIVDLLGK